MSGRADSRGLRILSEDDVRRSVDMTAAIGAVRRAFERLSSGRAQVPVRHALTGEGGDVLFVPGRLDGPARIGAKAISVYPGNADRGLEPVNATMLLIDPETGRARALLAGNHLTAVRTGAGEFSAGEIHAEIGEVAAGDVPGRVRDDEITFFKSVGNVVQDLAVGALALESARERGLGTRAPL